VVVGSGLGEVSVGVGEGEVSVGVGEGEVSVGVGEGEVSVGVGEGEVCVGVGEGGGLGEVGLGEVGLGLGSGEGGGWGDTPPTMAAAMDGEGLGVGLGCCFFFFFLVALGEPVGDGDREGVGESDEEAAPASWPNAAARPPSLRWPAASSRPTATIRAPVPPALSQNRSRRRPNATSAAPIAPRTSVTTALTGSPRSRPGHGRPPTDRARPDAFRTHPVERIRGREASRYAAVPPVDTRGGGGANVLEDLTVESFTGLVGETFRTTDDEGATHDLRLVEATDHEDRFGRFMRENSRAPFSLVFLGPEDPVMPQAIRRMEHDSLGTLEIFLVPIGRDAEGVRYEAVFN
jgi:hypothetical protein